MAKSKSGSGWAFNYIILPILVAILIGASTAIHIMAKSEPESQDKPSISQSKN